MSMPRVKLLNVFIVSLVFTFAACSSKEKKSDTVEGAYEIAKDFEKEERFDIAIQKYQEIRSKYPYSKYALQSEMAIADCYYKQESYPEAQVSFQSFKDLHPKHSKIDYVTYMLAMSYFKQLPNSIDRDLSQSSQAIYFFDEIVKNFPDSTYVTEAKQNRLATWKMLAQKEVYIADFYFKKKKYQSALVRYENALKKYPDMGSDERALSYGAISAARSGKKDKAIAMISELKSRFPKSNEIKSAEKEANQ